MKSSISSSLFAFLLISVMTSPMLIASPSDPSPTAPSSQPGATNAVYKMISGYKQPFDDDLQLHFSKGWTPVGGVSVTTWNSDLFFAQLLKKTSSE